MSETYSCWKCGNQLLDLLLPLKDLPATQVSADIDIADGRLGYGYIPHALTAVNGTLTMRGPRFSGQGISAELFGEPILIDVEPRDDGSTRALARGTIAADSLVEPVGVPLASYLRGATEWQAFVHFPSRRADDRFFIRLDSQLEGVDISVINGYAGHPDAAVCFDSSNPTTTDFDLAVRLTDVYPDGRSMLIADGACRLAARGRTDGLELLQPRLGLGAGPRQGAGEREAQPVEGRGRGEVERLEWRGRAGRGATASSWRRRGGRW